MNPNIAALRSVSPQHKAIMVKSAAERDAEALEAAKLASFRARMIAQHEWERRKREVAGISVNDMAALNRPRTLDMQVGWERANG